jgi:hypothetical protein
MAVVAAAEVSGWRPEVSLPDALARTVTPFRTKSG